MLSIMHLASNGTNFLVMLSQILKTTMCVMMFLKLLIVGEWVIHYLSIKNYLKTNGANKILYA